MKTLIDRLEREYALSQAEWISLRRGRNADRVRFYSFQRSA